MLYPFRALLLINRQRELWGFVLVPVVINLVVGVVLYAGLLVAGLQAIDRFIAAGGFWGGLLENVLRVILVLALFLGVGFLMVRFGVVLGAPWYGQLSERIEQLLLGAVPPQPPLSPATVVHDIWRALLFELKKLAFSLPISLLLLLVNFVPLAGQTISLVGGIALGALIACLDFFDGALERRRRRFREKLAYVFRHLPASAGFGLLAVGLCTVPLLNLLAIPICVAAGTIFFCERAERM